LKHLGPADRFFSVDEYGPFSVKQHGGRRRVRKGECPTVPQYQISKGRLIVTGGLELSTNQVTHFYSDKKDSGEMIALSPRSPYVSEIANATRTLIWCSMDRRRRPIPSAHPTGKFRTVARSVMV